MPNLFVDLPVPAANAAGVAVDVSAMGKTKSIIVGGNIDATVNIEYATDAGGVVFAPIATFQGGGNATVDVAAHWMRAVTSSYKSGTANADVGSSDSGSSFAQLVAPVGDGVGAPVAISALPEFKTVVVSGGFTGTLNIEVSEDGVDYAQVLTFHGGGGGRSIIYGAWARVQRDGTNGGPTPTVWMGGSNAAGGGGGGGATGPADAIGYFDALGNLTGDAKYTAIPLDPQGRPQVHDWRVAAGRGSIWRNGAWTLDGDPTDQVGEGFVTYGANALGNGPNGVAGGYGFITPYSFGRYQIIPGVNGGNTFLTCGFEDGSVNAPFGYNGFFVVDNLNQNQLSVDRATGAVVLGNATNPVAQLFINQAGNFNSNAGIQHSSLVANRASYRGNQFGANAGIPGITGFKSRGLTVGTLAAVIAGDVLFRATAIGVTGDNLNIPLAGTISINAALVATNYVATDFEVALVPLAGPINGRKEAFRVDSEGVLYVKEQANSMAGVAVLGAAGTVVIPNTRVKATTKFQVTAQDGGALLTGALQQSARTVGVDFTIRSTAGAGDAGVQVYYQLYEPTVP